MTVPVNTTPGTVAKDEITPPNDVVGQKTGTESALSTWVGPYVTDMLGRGAALADQPYEAYTGQLTAGESAPQTQAFQGIANLAVPTSDMGAFTPTEFTSEEAARRINPFIDTALDPQIADMRRQSEIQRIEEAGRLSRAGAYGAGRQAVMEAERNRGLLDRIARTRGQAQLQAYEDARKQFNLEQDRERQAQELVNRFGLDALTKQAGLGSQQRAIEAEGIAADRAQFEQEREYPYKMTQWQHSLLSGLPLETQSYTYAQPSGLANIIGGASGYGGLIDSFLGGDSGGGGIMDLLSGIFGGDDTKTATTDVFDPPI
jgi:hypothetical protein